MYIENTIHPCNKCGSEDIIVNIIIESVQKSFIKCICCLNTVGGFNTVNSLVDKWNIVPKEDDYLYCINIRFNSIGNGESLGDFEYYNKKFTIRESFYNETYNQEITDDSAMQFLDAFFFRSWDIEFMECSRFEDLDMATWSYADKKDSLIFFRYTYLETFCEITLDKVLKDDYDNSDNIYISSKSQLSM